MATRASVRPVPLAAPRGRGDQGVPTGHLALGTRGFESVGCHPPTRTRHTEPGVASGRQRTGLAPQRHQGQSMLCLHSSCVMRRVEAPADPPLIRMSGSAAQSRPERPSAPRRSLSDAPPWLTGPRHVPLGAGSHAAGADGPGGAGTPLPVRSSPATSCVPTRVRASCLSPTGGHG